MSLDVPRVGAAIAHVEDEFTALTKTAGLLDLSNRSRLCLLGADRAKFLHGQVTNDINGLAEHTGCYAALVNAKGKMESDLFAYRLAEEILLDFESGLADAVRTRLESFIIADDVEVADVAPHFGLLSVQGPKAAEVLATLELPAPESEFSLAKNADEIFVVNQPRLGSAGFDLFVPVDSIAVDGKIIDISLERLNTRYDAQNGGFGGAPKFPPAMRLELLLFEYRRTGDDKFFELDPR